MKKVEFIGKTTQKVWISLTGYRILIVLTALMQKSCTINELVKIVENNKLINKVTSKDTIRIDLNTLNLKALVTTQKLDKLIANAPNIGFISHPKIGIQSPAAKGIPITL